MSKTGPRPGSRFRTYAAPDREWMDDAACRGTAPSHDSALPGEKAEQTAARVEAALAVCHGCRVRMACREWTMAQPRRQREGVMGGQWWPVIYPGRASKPAA